MTTERIRIVGAVGSPYSRKLLAILRYRQIPHVWIHNGSPEAANLPRPKVALLPQLILQDDEGQDVARTDTTPLLRELETRFATGRSVLPPDPAIRFLDTLIEDYADEWLTKAMFHYRWAYPEDIAKAATILPRWHSSQNEDADLARIGEGFAKRQIERLWVVGSNDQTRTLIEESYRRFLLCFEDHLRTHRFLFGARPSAGDFAMYGQLTQLALFDPTPARLTLEIAPRVHAYTDLVDDLSGLEICEDGWPDRSRLPSTLAALLQEIGRVYPPFLLANAKALESGLDTVECTIDGEAWTQKPFPYQGKCLQWLREDYAALTTSDRAWVDQTITGTGLEALFA